jgi:hypothetical protein
MMIKTFMRLPWAKKEIDARLSKLTPIKVKSAEVLALLWDGLPLSPCTGYSGSTINNSVSILAS